MCYNARKMTIPQSCTIANINFSPALVLAPMAGDHQPDISRALPAAWRGYGSFGIYQQ